MDLQKIYTDNDFQNAVVPEGQILLFNGTENGKPVTRYKDSSGNFGTLSGGGGGGGADVTLGQIDADGNFQPLTFNGTEASNDGSPETVESYYGWNGVLPPPSGGIRVIQIGDAAYYKCASVDTTNKTWEGYKAVLDTETGIWSFETEITTGLTYDISIVPQIGKVYDGSAAMTATLYQGYPEGAILINCDTLDDSRFTATNCTLSTDIKKYGTGSIYTGDSGVISFKYSDADTLDGKAWTAGHFFYAESYTGGDGLSPLLNNDNDYSGAFMVGITSAGHIQVGVRGGGGSGTADTALTSGWHHLRVTRDSDDALFVYIDGKLTFQLTGFWDGNQFWIGKYGYGSYQFNGYIDGIEFMVLDDSTVSEYTGSTAPVPPGPFPE